MNNDPRRRVWVWIVVARYHQLGDLHFLRLHVLQAADEPRLALVRGVQRVPGRAVHRNVWLPADNLSALWLVADQIPRRGLVLARCGAPVGDAVRLEGQPTCRTLPPVELRLHRWGVRPDLRWLE